MNGIWFLTERLIPKVASARERFEAFSRSVRDVLAQRWVLTKNTYERENAKRIYYLSMEFLIGRSLANNVTNLLLDPLVQHAAREQGIDWLELIEQEPDAGLGTAAWAASRPASWTRWRPCNFPPRAMVCATSTACSSNQS